MLIVLLCELGERLVTMRDLLSAPAVATKPQSSAVVALLTGRIRMAGRERRLMVASVLACGVAMAALLRAPVPVSMLMGIVFIAMGIACSRGSAVALGAADP